MKHCFDGRIGISLLQLCDSILLTSFVSFTSLAILISLLTVAVKRNVTKPTRTERVSLRVHLLVNLVFFFLFKKYS